ncbi:16058_t:CDS:2, partial [Funneliformis caledonium]
VSLENSCKRSSGSLRGSSYAPPFSAKNFDQKETGYQTPEQISGYKRPEETELGYQTAKKENLGHERRESSQRIQQATGTPMKMRC